MFRTPNFSWRLAVAGWRESRTRRHAYRALLPTANRQPPTGESGFTLAALIVILTIISIIVAFTVPEQWSLVMKRERERQTIFLMKQYARAIWTFQRKHNAVPNSLEQLQDARNPRVIRGGGDWPLPLTGREGDWILVPQEAIIPAAPPGGVPPPAPPPPGGTPAPPPPPGVPGMAMGTGSRLNPAASPPDYKGPFVGVRPRTTGKSLIALHGAEDYGEWVYTYQDVMREMQMRQMAFARR